MKKSDILALNQALNRLGNISGVPAFTYGISRNISILEPEIKALQKALEPSPEYLKVDEKRLELAKEYAEKDEKGKPKKTRGADGVEKFVMADEDAFEKAFEELKEENKEMFDARLKQLEDYNALLETESEVKLHKIAAHNLPNMTVAQMHGIAPIIDEAIPSPYPTKA